MSYPDQMLLSKVELDVFIAQAFSPALMNAIELQELQVFFLFFVVSILQNN